MPLAEDGTIIPLKLQRYATRVVLEFTYTAPSAEYAQVTHEYLLEGIGYGVNTLEEWLAIDMGKPEVHVSESKSPQPVSPEGKGSETGGNDGV